MAFLYSKITRRFLISLILIWSMVAFWLLTPLASIRIMMLVLSVSCLLFIWYEIVPIAILIIISFLASYAFYGLFSQYNLPTWLIMIAILIIFGYLFLYIEQKIGILGNKRLIYLILFSLIILEIFLALTYFLINPLSLSLVISAVCYLFVGFCYAVLAQRQEIKFSSYLWIAGILIFLVLISSSWSI